MNLRKMLLLAGMALAAVAFAAPAAAQAEGTWTKNHEQLTENATVEIHGFVGFATAFGGFGCPAHGMATLEPGATGHGTIDTFTIGNTEGCEGTGFLAECELVEHEVTEGLPYTLTATPEDLDIIGDITVWNAYDPECSFGELEADFNEITVTADSPTTATNLQLSGQNGIITVAGQEIEAEAYGEGEITPAGVYGVH